MIRRIAGSLALTATMLVLGAAPALATPAWEVHLTRDEPLVSRSDERIDYTAVVKNVGADPTTGPITVEVELPGGLQTFVYMPGTSGDCEPLPASGAEPARAVCEHAGVLVPGVPLSFTVAAALGADAPELAVAKATVSGGGASAPAVATNEFAFSPPRPFEITGFETALENPDNSEYGQAGGHPFSVSTSFAFSLYRNRIIGAGPERYDPVEHARNIIVDTPRGFVGNALAVPKLCPSLDEVFSETCPPGSLVGGIDPDVLSDLKDLPIYAIEPEFGAPAQFAFKEKNSETTYTFVPRLRAEDGYAISFEASPLIVNPPLRGVSEVTICNFGATKQGDGRFKSCLEPDDSEANPIALITAPTRCAGQEPTSTLRVDSWEHPGDFKTRQTTDPLPTGCEKVPFEPQVDLSTTSAQADSPTGLDVEITMPTDGLEGPEGISQANLDTATVTFPRGMSVNPASAHGLGACTPTQVKMGSNADDECPLSSRVGTVEIDTPLIQETLTGHVYVAKQNDNPFKSTLGLYMVFSSKKDGITIKVAGKLVPDPVTGQLTSIFTENPEAPFSRLVLHFTSGPRAPLINPPKCGTYAIHSELSPWSAASPANPTPDEIVSADSTYEVSSGPGGGPCPSGALEPSLRAGLQNPVAGSKSPFVLKLSREDGSQRFTALDVSMPPGLTAYLKGIPYCPDFVLAGISAAEETGRPELVSPACPAASQVGTVQAGAGAGPNPFYAPGRAYFAGPYKGAPLSLAIVTPAVAGPFDLGNVVVRNALYVDPVTSQVTVKSDPIPTILHGLLLDVRDIRVNVDRPNFTAAPTNCAPMSVGARVSGEGGASASLSNHFQVSDCAALGFKPKLELRLFGGTKRGAHPRLRATLTARPGDANIAGASVALPHSEFLDQAHIRTICTRVQFAAKTCPQGSVYGHAEAMTPLLDHPLSGPVYLRSSNNPLPDLVVALRGPDSQPIEVVLAGRVDSVNGGIRNTFDVVPDQPVSSFTLSMQGGKKGLLVNSRDICKSVNRATVKFRGQNGKAVTLRPKLQNSCKKGAKKAKKQKRGIGR